MDLNFKNLDRILFFAIGCALCLSGCDEDSFSQVVEVDIPEHKPQLVLNGLLHEGDSILRFHISTSRGILDDHNSAGIPDATVRILENDQTIGIARRNASEHALYSYDNILEYVTNMRISVEVEAEGFLNVRAEDVMPTKVDIREISFKKDGGISLDGYTSDLIVVEFQDPVGEENYYAIDAYIDNDFYWVDPNGDTMRFSGANHLYLDTNDPLVNWSYNYGLVFSDAAFDGKEVRIEALANTRVAPDSLMVTLTSLSRNGYLYDRSFTNFRDNDGNPFAEPVTVHSNVEDGFGILAVGRKSKMTIPIRE